MTPPAPAHQGAARAGGVDRDRAEGRQPVKVFGASTGTGQLTTKPLGWLSGVPLNCSTSPASSAACTSCTERSTRACDSSSHLSVKWFQKGDQVGSPAR